MRSVVLFLALGCTPPLVACSASAPSSTPKPAVGKAAPASDKGKAAKPLVAIATPATTTATVGVAPAVEDEEKYSYQSGGRRDPFLTLVSKETGKPAARDVVSAVPKRGDGVAGILVNEIVVRGVVQMDSRLVALVQGKDGRSYNVHQADRLADGTVKAVTAEGLVIMQDLNDPLSKTKQREVRKLLRSLEEAKQ